MNNTGDRSAQHRQVGRISAKDWRHSGGLYNNADSTKEGADLIDIAPWKI
jgi:hypothetical protein